MTETVPVIPPPVERLATIGVPSDRLVNSPGVAGRPPSLETNAWLPSITTWRGAFPTGICLISVLVEVSITPSVLAPLSATYSLLPSAESAIPDGSQALSGPVAVGPAEPTSGIVTGEDTVPSGFTAKRIRSVVWGNHRVFPSAEYSGPSAATVSSPSAGSPVAPVPSCWTILPVLTSKMVRNPLKLFQLSAANLVPSGLSVLDTSRALGSSIRSPIGEIHWFDGSRIAPFASWPT